MVENFLVFQMQNNQILLAIKKVCQKLLATKFVFFFFDFIRIKIIKKKKKFFKCGEKGHYANRCYKGVLAFLSTTAHLAMEQREKDQINHQLPKSFIS